MDDWLPPGCAKWRDAITKVGKAIYGATWTGSEHIAGAVLAPTLVMARRSAMREKVAKAKAAQGTVLGPLGRQRFYKHPANVQLPAATPARSDATILDALYRADQEARSRYREAARAIFDEIWDGLRTAIISSSLQEIPKNQWAAPDFRRVILDPQSPLADAILLKDAAVTSTAKPLTAKRRRKRKVRPLSPDALKLWSRAWIKKQKGTGKEPGVTAFCEAAMAEFGHRVGRAVLRKWWKEMAPHELVRTPGRPRKFRQPVGKIVSAKKH